MANRTMAGMLWRKNRHIGQRRHGAQRGTEGSKKDGGASALINIAGALSLAGAGAL
jgi:hypothetical protein